MRYVWMCSGSARVRRTVRSRCGSRRTARRSTSRSRVLSLWTINGPEVIRRLSPNLRDRPFLGVPHFAVVRSRPRVVADAGRGQGAGGSSHRRRPRSGRAGWCGSRRPVWSKAHSSAGVQRQRLGEVSDPIAAVTGKAQPHPFVADDGALEDVDQFRRAAAAQRLGRVRRRCPGLRPGAGKRPRGSAAGGPLCGPRRQVQGDHGCRLVGLLG